MRVNGLSQCGNHIWLDGMAAVHSQDNSQDVVPCSLPQLMLWRSGVMCDTRECGEEWNVTTSLQPLNPLHRDNAL